MPGVTGHPAIIRAPLALVFVLAGRKMPSSPKPTRRYAIIRAPLALVFVLAGRKMPSSPKPPRRYALITFVGS